MDKHETPAQIRDRIRGLRRVRPSELRRNPQAWKKHTPRQRKALKDVMTEIGFADALLARELEDGSLELIDGELRAGIADDQVVPVIVLDVAAPAGPQMLQFALVLSKLGIWRQTLVWVKDAFVLGRSDYHYRHEVVFAGAITADDVDGKSHELVLYGWRPGAKHTAPEDRTWSTVLEYARPKANRLHPTMKPVDLWGDLMRNGSIAGDIVLDLFGGAGVTAIVAEQLGRRARLVELDPRFCDVIVQRWQTLTGLEAVRESDGVAFDEVSA
jgi:site-specific DNA-methyltransferase (adenine-specific)